MSLLQITNVERKYKGKQALAPLTLTLETGECLVLCGGNGAGKSTLLQILAGISPPTSGSVTLQAIDMKMNHYQYVSQIGYMPDDFHAQETMTVLEFLSFYATFRNVSSARIKEVLVQLGLEGKKKVLLKHLSKGMRQRLLFGQAILSKPTLLILDEPTNGLDPYWVNSFTSLLCQIKMDGTAIIFSTHMMDIAAHISDRILFLEEGKVIKTLKNEKQDEQQFTLQLLQLYHK